MSWEHEAIELKFKQNKSWRETATAVSHYFPGQDIRTIQERVRRRLRDTDEYKDAKVVPVDKMAFGQNKDGTYTSDRLISIAEGEELTPELLLKAHNLDSTRWSIVSYTNNLWHGMTGKQNGNKRLAMYQSKVVCKPKTDISEEDIDHYLENKKFKYDKPLTEPLQYDTNGETLEIDLPDFHGGMLAWIQETGADYDIHIAKDLFFKCLYDIVERCKGRKFKKIILATLGDLIHIDNDMQTTSKGTFQQSDGRMAKITDAGMDMLIDGITLLVDIAPVHVVYLAGNHDRVSGRLVMQTVHMAFRSDPNVTFDMSPNPQKHIEMGSNLIGLTHGCMAGKNMDKWLQVQARAAWGRCKHVEVHQGHIHTQKFVEGKYIVQNQTEDIGGVVVRTLPVICNASYWEHTEGYIGATKAMMCFVWHDAHGLREMWFSCV